MELRAQRPFPLHAFHCGEPTRDGALGRGVDPPLRRIVFRSPLVDTHSRRCDDRRRARDFAAGRPESSAENRRHAGVCISADLSLVVVHIHDRSAIRLRVSGRFSADLVRIGARERESVDRRLRSRSRFVFRSSDRNHQHRCAARRRAFLAEQTPFRRGLPRDCGDLRRDFLRQAGMARRLAEGIRVTLQGLARDFIPRPAADRSRVSLLRLQRAELRAFSSSARGAAGSGREEARGDRLAVFARR